MEKIISLAFDFGASSGRAIVSTFDGEKIELEEVHRFLNEPVIMGSHIYWDTFRLFHDLKQGLKKASSKFGKIHSIGIDTWAVDYGLLDENDNIIGMPIHYRDTRTEGMMEKVKQNMSLENIYDITGIQFMELNTVYQLMADKKFRPHIIEKAKTLLLMPDLFNYYLTGKKYNEYTNASTTQMLDAKSKKWSKELIEKLDLPYDILQEIIEPGNIIGNLTKEVQAELEVDSIPVVAVGSHDTASAVCGAPLEGNDSVYLSCGTWSLLGIESKKPIISGDSARYNFTNEGGVEDTIRFLKNINGLWLLQQLRKSWSERVEEIGFPDIIKAVLQVENKDFIIDPNHESFMAPHNMIEAIQNYCVENNQGKPEKLGELAIAAYNGLTSEYKKVVECIEEIAGESISTINMVGGGIQDKFLCQQTANVTGKKVLAGPIEASVLGNIVMQLKAIGAIETLEQGRKIIKNSFETEKFLPEK
ncbi:rhamnulokinase [Clostridium grantii]|uniref:Rhamnulokinase n=1 Tax=Clostridium grantii DSM 8605 TaxID=1121316 RepID=A0A1M5SXJ5_9CLOT|nr:rhamnulokinase family protein [Clostridium grantii]SHH42853.1 rhamnulokinase [Clostridium grantii DSM 8605]